MKHKRSKRTLGRSPSHRQSMLKNMSSDLLFRKSIVTTPAKAKELVKYLSPLLSKVTEKPTLQARRQFIAKLNKPSDIGNLIDANNSYLRTTKVFSNRHDGAPQVKLQIEGNEK